ncbi:FHA domain-containing protein [Cryobacterium sp. W22_MBD10_FK3]|uniref:FHA domain-containing protein n=1 Tax=Cryobacterium sp. W22_MBD10_FK3 TaxID=3240273 RepID=UPI003F93CD93
MDKPNFIVPPPGMFPTSDNDDQSTARVHHAKPLVVVPPTHAAPVTPAFEPGDAAPPTGPSPAVVAIPAFVPAPLGKAPVPPRAAAPAHPADAKPAGIVTGWSLRLADGQRMPVTGSLVFGRDPVPVTRRAATMVSVVDPALSVSKSHALVELNADDELSVTDLHSTNGVSLIGADGIRVELEPGIRTPVLPGMRLMLGEFPVEVSRG